MRPVQRVARRRARMNLPLLALLLMALPLVLAAQAVAAPTEELEAARRAFVVSRNAGALYEVLRRFPRETSAEERWLARRAASPVALAAGRAATPLMESLAQLRGGDLVAAARSWRRLVASERGVRANWFTALLRASRGDEAGAQASLMAPPLYLAGRDDYALALLGAALEGEDRRVLLGAAHGALFRAARRGRLAALPAIAQGAAVLAPRTRNRWTVPATRALRRAGRAEAAEALVARPAHPAEHLERAILAWQQGDLAQVRTAARLGAANERPAGRVLAALGRVQFPPERGTGRAPLASAWGDAAVAPLVIRLADALGRSIAQEGLETRAALAGGSTASPSVIASALGVHRLTVVHLLGDVEAARELLRARLPFLMMRLVRVGAGYEESAALVVGHDPATDLLQLDQPDPRRLDLLPATELAKARLLVALPVRHGRLAERLAARPQARSGRLLARGLSAPTGAPAAELEQLAREGAAGALYAAWLVGRGPQPDATRRASWARQAAASEPAQAFEAATAARSALDQGQFEAARAALSRLARLEAPSLAAERMAFEAARGADLIDEAVAALERARALAPLDPDVLRKRALLREELMDEEGAATDLRRLLRLVPRDVPVALALVRLELRAGRPEVAVRTLDALERRMPELSADRQVRLSREAAEAALMKDAPDLAALRQLRRTGSPVTRRRLAHELADRDDQEGEALLRTLLGDEDPGVRQTVLRLYRRRALRRRVGSDPLLLRLVAEILRKDPDRQVREAAADLLGLVPGSVSTRVLAERLAGAGADPAPSVRALSARGLERRGDRRAEEALVAALIDAHLEVRIAAGDTLFRLAGTRRDYEAEKPTRKAVDAWRRWLERERDG